MPSDRTTVTELGTGLGMLGLAGIDEAAAVAHGRDAQPVARDVGSPGPPARGGAYDAEFHAAWANGQAFLGAGDGLRGRLPRVVEWKGTGRAPATRWRPSTCASTTSTWSAASTSRTSSSTSPRPACSTRSSSAGRAGVPGGAGGAPRRRRLVRRGGAGRVPGPLRVRASRRTVGRGRRAYGVRRRHGTGQRSAPARPGSSPAVVALPGLGAAAAERTRGRPASERRGAGRPLHRTDLPPRAVDLTVGAARGARALAPAGLAARCQGSLRHPVGRRGPGLRPPLGGGHGRPAAAPARPCSGASCASGARPTSCWAPRRTARCGCASPPRGTGASSSSWSPSPWRAKPGGQPRVGWEAVVRDRASHEVHRVVGHIEVRWSHGRFGGLPEAKGYLDTPHHLVPGYFTLR